MCTTCGCGSSLYDPTQPFKAASTRQSPLHFHTPPSPARQAESRRRIALEQDILAKNNAIATANRARYAHRRQLAVNLMSSPGSGKTTLLVETITRLCSTLDIAVIEGDQQTDNDARRIRASGVPAIQINTGKGCHLDAAMVEGAMDKLDVAEEGLVFIENVGNLVCPAGFDLGEALRVVILSVTEGDDKPLKYPDMFHGADLVLLNKVDLLPYVEFDVDRCVDHVRHLGRDTPVLQLSATRGTGMDQWCRWLLARHPGREPVARQV